jgi:hypothetical protein
MAELLCVRYGTKAQYAAAAVQSDVFYIITNAAVTEPTLYLGTVVLARMMNANNIVPAFESPADDARYLRNDGTYQTITPAKIGAAPSWHGYHVPIPETANSARFLRNDNTWFTVTPANIGAAPSSHGNHVPAVETANNSRFLRNDNTWQTLTPDGTGLGTTRIIQSPSTPAGNNQYLWFNPNNMMLYVFYGSAWQPVRGAAAP